jgi:hypothetical protein
VVSVKVPYGSIVGFLNRRMVPLMPKKLSNIALFSDFHTRGSVGLKFHHKLLKKISDVSLGDFYSLTQNFVFNLF